MAGFDNGTLQGSVFAQAKQFGAILRGFGPPAPVSGVVGDLYVDTQTWLLYGKSEAQATDPWGGWVFEIPAQYRSGLKWFGASLPSNSVGVDGDYCLLWGGFNNYGVQPSIFGPKVSGCWPESGDGPAVFLDPAYVGYALPVGLSDEGAPVAFSASTQLIAAGLVDEYILAIPVLQVVGVSITELGLQSTPANVVVPINPLYSATETHAI